jgi:putative MATE family efflux protein
MLLNFLGICINMVADPLLMVVLKFGAAGAALATVFAKMIPAIIAFILLNNRNRTVYLDLRKLRFEKKKMLDIITIGLPSAIGGSVTQFAFLLLTKSVLKYGREAMAAYGVGNKINGLISLPSNGIGSAVATIVSQNMGAGQEKRAQKAYKMAMFGIVIFLFAGGMILSREPVATAIVQIFTDDPAVVVMGSQYLSILAFWCFFNGVHNSTMGFFQGCGHTEVTMTVDILRLWVFRFATLFVCQQILHLGVESIWYCVVVSNALTPVVLVVTYLTGYWRKKRV